MAKDGDTKREYTRDYVAHEPPVGLGPYTWILDTIVLPVVKEEEEDASTR